MDERGELGFQGVTIADAIGMKGLQKNRPAEEISVDAVIAACDCICLTSEGAELLGKVFDRLMKAVASERRRSGSMRRATKRNHNSSSGG